MYVYTYQFIVPRVLHCIAIAHATLMHSLFGCVLYTCSMHSQECIHIPKLTKNTLTPLYPYTPILTKLCGFDIMVQG